MTKKVFNDSIIKSLSPLESSIIKFIRLNKKYSSQEIYGLINKKTKVSRSSIPVILDRLHSKGLLSRETKTSRGGIRFIYQLQLNKEKFERRVVENTVNALVKRFGDKAITYFNESVAKQKIK